LADPATHISRLPLRPPNGQADRRALAAPRVGSEDRDKSVLPRNDLEATVLRIWQQVLGLDSIGVTHNFFDVGGHSLLAIRLMAEIQNATGKQLPMSTLFEGATVEYLASSLSRLGQSPNKVIVEIQGGNAKPPFFGIVAPGARGHYIDLARHLGKSQPFYRIQGASQPKDLTYTAIEYENLAAEYIEAIKTAQPRGPYYLGGGCQGARIAFDMARLLEAQGEKVGLLAIFDTWVIENSRNRLLFQVYHYSMRLKQIWHSTRQEKWQTLLRGVKHPFRRRGPSNLLVSTLWPGRDFVPAKCTARITVFKVPKQPFYYVDDPLLGWGTRTTGGVELQLVDTGHRYLLREPHAFRLAEKLADSLGHASSRAGDYGRRGTSELVDGAACRTR
jgi:thioesterase domain-containing protein/acyl carrier protein